MPELPEVETTRRGIADLLIAKVIVDVTVRDSRLRWPVPAAIREHLQGRVIRRIERRAKYLLFFLDEGYFIFHLGMSGSLRIYSDVTLPEKHDHIDIVVAAPDAPPGCFATLRYRDPRRFGALLWQPGVDVVHSLLTALGPEPLESGFNADYLYMALRRKTCPIKLALMDNHVVVGVGNIYANESLFLAGISPRRVAMELSRGECARLVAAVRQILDAAILAGGSTLRDFVDSAGKPGYFQQQYAVYGRQDQLCTKCGDLIRHARLGQRSTFWCSVCQPQ